MTDYPLSPDQMFAARTLIHLTRRSLAQALNTKLRSVVEYEVEGKVAADFDPKTVRAYLEAAGVEFIDENGGGTGVRLKRSDAGSIPAEELNASNDE